MKKKNPLLAVSLTLLFNIIFPGPLDVWPQPQDARGANYNLVRNLEPMSDKEPAPNFTLPLLSARDLSGDVSLWRRWWGSAPASRVAAEQAALEDFRGKLVLLNFWATWCEPCREEMPAMERLYQEFKGKGFVVLAVNVKDKQRDALAFFKELNLTYPALFDPEGKTGLLYGAWGLPTTYLIGRDGRGLARLWGPADWHGPGARELMQTLLEQKK